MGQKGFLYDQQYCIGCQACQVACRVRNNLTPGVYPRKATNYQLGLNGIRLSLACNHCERPACVEVCPVGALTKRSEDGVVVHDPEVCIGCLSCQAACPYDAPQYNDITGKMVKCDMCAERVDLGEDPACVSACPLKVLTIGDIEELEAQGGVPQGEGFTVAETGPNIRFIPLDRG